MRPYHLCNVHVYILIYKMQKAKKKKKTYTQKEKKRQIKYDTGKKRMKFKKKYTRCTYKAMPTKIS